MARAKDCLPLGFETEIANTPMEKKIIFLCGQLALMLIGKNRSYGNSVEKPVSIFAPALSPIDKIHVRMDDKLKRILTARETGKPDNEDAELDLTGYLVLKRAMVQLTAESAKEGEPRQSAVKGSTSDRDDRSTTDLT